MLIQAERSALLVIDLQERLVPAMHDPAAAVANAVILLRAAARLGVPVLLSEQYPTGLGPTMAAIAALAPPESIVAKVHFSCLDDSTYLERFNAFGRQQAVICGVEAHVCVLQTALGLKESGHDCAVVADAVASRAPASKEAALGRLRQAGVEVVTAEMVVFEWLAKAGTPEFKEVSALIR